MRPNLANAQPGDFFTYPLTDGAYMKRRMAFLYVQRVVPNGKQKVVEGKICEVHLEGSTSGSFQEFHATDCAGDCRAVGDCWFMSCGSHVTHPDGPLCDCLKRCCICGFLECTCKPVEDDDDYCHYDD